MDFSNHLFGMAKSCSFFFVAFNKWWWLPRYLFLLLGLLFRILPITHGSSHFEKVKLRFAQERFPLKINSSINADWHLIYFPFRFLGENPVGKRYLWWLLRLFASSSVVLQNPGEVDLRVVKVNFHPFFHQLLKFYSTAETITAVAKAQLAKAKRKARGADFSFHSFSWLFNYFLNGFWFLSSLLLFFEDNVFGSLCLERLETTPNICLEIKVMTTLQFNHIGIGNNNLCGEKKSSSTRRFSHGAIIAFLWFSLSQTKVWNDFVA